MKCQFCGFENEEAFSFCPNCGAATQPSTSEVCAPAQPVNTAAETILQALKHPLFFVLCILVSASCALTLIQSGPDVLSILFTIFLWLTYAKSRKDIADASHLRCVSGTLYAQYIIVNVCAILLIVVGAILGLGLFALGSDLSFVNEMLSELDLGADVLALFGQLSTAVLGTVIFIAFVIAGVLMLVVNLFSTRYIHRFAKSVYQSIASGALTLKHAKAAHGWLWAFGVISGIGALGNLGSGDLVLILSSGASCAAPIIAAILIKKYLLTEE